MRNFKYLQKLFFLVQICLMLCVMQSCKKTRGTKNGHEWVDLGLSVKWATCNVGADSPEEYGDYYAWGETTTKSNYSWDSHKWGHWGRPLTTRIFKYCTHDRYGIVDNKTVLDLEDDIASVNWGDEWRMPTQDEINELLDKCVCIWTNKNGINGQLIIGLNGNQIFLPASGHRVGTELLGRDSCGYYWSATLDEYEGFYALGLDLNNDGAYGFKHWFRYFGHTIRPVME